MSDQNDDGERMNLINILNHRVARGHYICLCSPNNDGEFSAAIYANMIPVSRQYITRFYWHRNPCIAINLALNDHRKQQGKPNH